jgi:hypothetical protein
VILARKNGKNTVRKVPELSSNSRNAKIYRDIPALSKLIWQKRETADTIFMS